MDVYRKTGVANVALEFQRSLALYELSLESLVFSAPQPLRADATARMLEFRCLPAGCSLKDAFACAALGLMRVPPVRTAFRDTGVALASIHNVIDRGRIQSRFAVVDEANASAALLAHGDFWTGNVWIARDGYIWIHDPVVPKRRHTHAPELMSDPWNDLASFLFNLGVVHPFCLLPLIRQTWVRECETAFLEGYCGEYRGVFDQHRFRHALMSTFQDYETYLSGCGRWVRSSVRMRYARRRFEALKAATSR